MYLVSELEPFVKSRVTMFVRAPLKPRKAIGLEPFVKFRVTMFVRAPLELLGLNFLSNLGLLCLIEHR